MINELLGKGKKEDLWEYPEVGVGSVRVNEL